MILGEFARRKRADRDEYFVERFPTVHQMTTTVVGDLRDDVSLFEIFKASFPAGSITGAPKVRASQIIQEIEPTARGIYCGSIGLFYPGGDFVCNVAIRTLEINGSIATLGIGSGIVADSDPEREWDEVLLKSKFLERRPQIFGLYEAFRYIPEVGYKDIENHLRRLEHSCVYFGRPFPRDKILCKLEQLKAELGDKPNRVRLDLDGEDISFKLIPEELGWTKGGISVMIPETTVGP
ncbi:MAG: chorismate-binding protein [bacterium]|nr:chorismate-binding protein [bacterium]